MITLDRFRSDNDGTFGHLLSDINEILCYTCELPWRQNQPEISCIPCGVYQVEPYSSPLHPDVWHLMNVPNRIAILIHQGNTILDVRGCICVGDSLGTVKDLPAVLHSIDTFKMLKTQLPASFEIKIQSSLPEMNFLTN